MWLGLRAAVSEVSQFNDTGISQRMTVRFVVKGRVQGVFFRASARSEAKRLALTGWVKNRPDGDVEGTVTGDAPALSEFSDWLSHGPEMAKVTSLEVEQVALEQFDGFVIR